MPKKPGNQSGAASVVEEGSSVYDFLYQDAPRIGSFLGQFDPSGHLQALKQSISRSGTAASKFTMSGGIGFPGIAKADAGGEDQATESEGEASERTYDPLWGNALTLLDYLTERDFIRRDVSTARIGQFVLSSGALAVWDLSMIKSFWDAPAIQEAIRGGVRQQPQQAPPNRTARRHPTPGPPTKILVHDQVQLFLEVMRTMPHTLQARLQIDLSTTIWAGLRSDGLTVSSSDLFLKHGSVVSGRWSMLGILDALPNVPAGQDTNEAKALLAALAGTPIGTIMTGLVPILEFGLARPVGAYGMTPLLIFREVA